MKPNNDKRSFIEKVFAKTFGSAPVTVTVGASSTPATTIQQPMVKQFPQDQLVDVLHKLESAYGKDPNTPKANVVRRGVVPGANANEKARPFTYTVGYGGEFGLTPDAIANLMKSRADKSGPQNRQGYTKFIQDYQLNKIQNDLLQSASSSGALAKDFFIRNKASSTDFRPETLANDYMENYVTKASPNYTEANRQRALRAFMERTK